MGCEFQPPAPDPDPLGRALMHPARADSIFAAMRFRILAPLLALAAAAPLAAQNDTLRPPARADSVLGTASGG